MSRRKQSRPQHVGHDGKNMPGTDFTITDNKIRLAVSSAGPQIKLESTEEKRPVTTFEMTPTTTSQENVNLTQDGPSSVVNQREIISNGYVSPVDKMTDHEVTTECSPKNNSPKPVTESLAMTKTTKSASCGSLSSTSPALAHQSSRCRRVSAGTVDFTKVKSEYCMSINKNTKGSENNGKQAMLEYQAEEYNSLSHDETKEIAEGNKRPINSPENQKLSRRPQFQRHRSAVETINTPMITLERKHECEKCGVSFRSRETYEVHTKHYCSGKRREVECHLCEAKFDDDKRLQIHMEVHSLQYICLVCSQRMSNPEACQNHMQLHAENLKAENSKDGMIPCPSCNLLFEQKPDVLVHLCAQHVTVSNLPPFMYPHMITQTLAQPSINEHTMKTSKSGFSNTPEQPKTPPRNKLDDVDLHNISPPVITSTPARPLSGSTAINSIPSTPASAFSCIVCGIGFPDVVTLQRHLLTSHTAAVPQKAPSPLPPPTLATKSPQRQNSRLNCRKVSTVSAPQLSLLSGPSPRKISEPTHPKTQMEPPRTPISPTEAGRRYSPNTDDDIANKKRKERSDNEEPGEQGLKRAKRDSSIFHSKVNNKLCVTKDNFEARRVSCPVVSNKMLAAEQLGLPGTIFTGPHEEERNCIQCDIRFSSAANYRAHKKYYCASRHMHKLNEDIPPAAFLVPQSQPDDLSESTEFLSVKSRKRNVGNRSSITSRKRSHLTPLETVRGSPPCQETNSSTTKLSSVRKSCPSHLDATTPKSPSPNRETSPIPAPQASKKHLCQECNIWFSKYDTYMAHKKYYCESRRKDRVSVRSLHASAKMPLKRKSESNLRESLARSENPLFVPEHISWSPQRSTPSTEAEDDRGNSATDSSTHIERKISSTSETTALPFPMYGQMDPEMLARISFMQPLILNQYLTMLREKMTQNAGLLFPNLPFASVPASRSLSPEERTRKHSVDEIRSGRFSNSPSSSSTKHKSISNIRPTRQSCVAAINVKQEPTDDAKLSLENRGTPRHRSSPLDLSNKLDVTHDIPDRKSPLALSASPVARYPTIDLRTTALAIVKQEPNLDSGNTYLNNNHQEGNMDQPKDNGNNSNNNSDLNISRPEIRISDIDGSVSISVSSQEKEDSQNPPQKSRAQHCKNCDARFTSLSTFIAHKKYYCSGTNNSGLIRNDAKAAQMAH